MMLYKTGCIGDIWRYRIIGCYTLSAVKNARGFGAFWLYIHFFILNTINPKVISTINAASM